MELSELRVFVTVASERSFSRAAEKLFRTQPAVSQAIRRLEDELGERLFDRTMKNGALTPAGQVLYGEAARLLKVAEETEAAVRQGCAQARARVRIGGDAIAEYALLPILTRFRERCPAIAVEVRSVGAAGVAGEVATGVLDFGLVSERTAPNLQRIELVIAIVPCHAAARSAAARFASDPLTSVVALVCRADDALSPAALEFLRVVREWSG